MKIDLPEKWINKVSEDDRARTVAVKTLNNRLRAVFKLLPLAADKADEDMEYIHQLRVWTRRASAALELYEDLIPHRHFAWMKKQLKRIRHAANYARDCDILISRLSAEEGLPEVRQRLCEIQDEREQAQLTVIAVHERLSRDGRGLDRVEKLLQRLRSRKDKPSDSAKLNYRDWARKQLHPFVEKFFRAVPLNQSDVTAMHQFRIRGKKLRYVMELLPSAFPANFRSELYPVIESMQDRLGEINDLAVAKVRLQQNLELMTDEDAAAWRILMEREQSRLHQVMQAFWEWCTPEKLQQLRNGFDSMLQAGENSPDGELVSTHGGSSDAHS